MGTKRRIVDEIKIDPALVAQSLASTNATGRYFNMTMWRKVMATAQFAAMVAAGTVKVEFLQAKDRSGTSAKAIGSLSATSTALVGGQVMKLVLATFLATGTITCTLYKNGAVFGTYVFTAHATVTTLASRQFSISGSDTADGDELCKCLNDVTYGLPGCFAVNAAGTVSIYAVDDYTVIGLASSPDDATVVKSTVEGELIIEADKSAFDVQNGFTWVAVKVTVASATVLCSANIARLGRFNPTQQAAIAPVTG